MTDSINITFDAYYGDEKKIVEISEVFGAGAGRFHLSIDRYHQGSLAKINGEWQLHSNTNLLTSTDIQILGEMIEERLALGIPQQFISKGIVSTKFVDTICLSDKSRHPRNVMLMDITLNRGNSGGPIIKVGQTAADDEVIAMSDFIINPTGGNINIVIDRLKSSGGIVIQGVDPNLAMAQLLEYLSSTSVGVSGGMSIDYFYNGWKK